MKFNLSSLLATLAVLSAFSAAAPAPTQSDDLEVSTVYQQDQEMSLTVEVASPDGLDARGLKKRQPAETDAGVDAVLAGLISKAQMTSTTQPVSALNHVDVLG